MSLLDQVTIAVPCHVSWAGMTGNDQVRHCQCRQQVYDLSVLTRAAAEALVAEKEGRLCVRLYRRPDGTVITKDCGARLRSFRRTLAASLAMAAVLLIAILGWVSARQGDARSGRSIRLRSVEPIRTIMRWFDPPFERQMGIPAIKSVGPAIPSSQKEDLPD